jgi:hypothetical protein
MARPFPCARCGHDLVVEVELRPCRRCGRHRLVGADAAGLLCACPPEAEPDEALDEGAGEA